MARLVQSLRSGAWLTRERMRLIALALLAASALGLVFVVATSDGLNDYQGRPLGTDFSNIYVAGTWVLDGHPAAPFDLAKQYARAKTIFGAETPAYGWHYPPFFLFVAGALALMPYWLSLLVWQSATFALYVWAMRALVAAFIPPLKGEGGSSRSEESGGVFSRTAFPHPVRLAAEPPSPASGGGKSDRLWLLLVLAYPAVFVNIGHGHNGFLTAALLIGALVVLDRRPLIAGVLLGLLAYKPQFGLMIPLVLVATGRWRTCAAAAATVAALAVITTLAFRTEVWRAAFASTAFTREVVLEQGNIGWHKIQSVFAWVRMWGGDVPLAYAAQGLTAASIAGLLVWLWRGQANYSLKAAALCIATILATPYSLDYDLVVIAPAIAFFALHGLASGFAAYEKTALALVWFMPLIARTVAENAMIPLGVISLLILLALIARRAAANLRVGAKGLSAAEAVR
jgi:alpha-1,2-mannosyltransferase